MEPVVLGGEGIHADRFFCIDELAELQEHVFPANDLMACAFVGEGYNGTSGEFQLVVIE